MILYRGFCSRSPNLRRYLKIPEGTAPIRGPGAVPVGILKSPLGEGIWGKLHEIKSEFCIYFLVIKSKTIGNDR